MAQAALTKTVNITYKEDSGPFILYNVGESADVGIYRTYSPPMTKMYFKVVNDYTEGEEYDDSGVEYEVWENTSNGTKTVATVGKNQALLLKAYEKKSWGNSYWSSYISFVMTKGKFKAYGKIGALDGYYTKLRESCYKNMFYNCTSLIKAPELPATTLASNCYYQMFYGCTGLTEIPENLLPVTTLAGSCYAGMFQGCTGLTNIPENLLPATELEYGCYRYMFCGCTGLTKIPENLLPATTLATQCYSAMFCGCTGLTNIPNLPATTLASSCYGGSMYYHDGMFQGCTSLTEIPENLLPVTILLPYCYNYMFQGCTGLTKIPENLLPATTLTNYCYTGMFRDCTGLTNIPENLLPATTLADGCYREMFYKCTGLTNVPNLPATTLADFCYTDMFCGCTSLTNVPENLLPVTALKKGCYEYMFYGCTGLTEIPENLLPATTLTNYCYAGMFQGCTGLTNIPENLLPATTLAEGCYGYISSGYTYGMFQGCTGLTEIPENLLPATTLTNYCYTGMFQGCTSLTEIPNLPATTLANYCYQSMFQGCTKLSYIKALFTTTPGSGYTNNWVNGVASSGTFVKNYLAEWDVTGVSGIPSGWTVQLNATHVSWDSLEITADDVIGRKTTTTIHYTLTETVLDEDGVTQFQGTRTGNVVSDAFEQNTSYTDTVTRTITYKDTQSGLTATTTITQGVWVDVSYTVDLNSQWQESSKNPDSSLYDCYESFSNYHVDNANAIMYITIVGYTEFSLYIRSYGESSCDYLVVGNLDATSISRTTSGVKATTYGNSQAGTTISSYTKVTFSGLDEGEHKIPILYGKDGSANTGDDKGYIIIEKNQ